jgi:thioredoxin reductase (NADPH)
MRKPVILALDDDENVLRAVGRDLKTKYGSEYRILRAESGESALNTLEDLKLRGDETALFLVDQRMPGMTGVEFLEKAKEIYPEAGKVLLTAYADTEAAINAINDIQIDYYLLKPWDPPEDKLFPVISDLLYSWESQKLPKFSGIRLVGYQWSPQTHDIKDFLTRNNIPYLWLDYEKNEEAVKLLEISKMEESDLPCLIFEDGEILKNPEIKEIADKAGLQTSASQVLYDLIIVGAGPAGLAAAVYGASEGLKTLLVEKQAPGGQAGTSSRIENYLGFPNGISGNELARRAVTQAKRFGVEILTAQEVVKLNADGPLRSVQLNDGTQINSRVILIATGVAYRKLKTKGIEKLTGAGVYYGATLSEGESVRNEDVFIVGGANSAGQAAMYFSRFANSVTMVVRGESLSSSMSQYLIDQIKLSPNIQILTNSEVIEVQGSNRLEKLIISRKDKMKTEKREACALFIFIGAIPNTGWLKEDISLDEYGFIKSGIDLLNENEDIPYHLLFRPPYMLETSVPGIFVAGDVRHGSVKRVASSVGEGSMAVMYVHLYMNSI